VSSRRDSLGDDTGNGFGHTVAAAELLTQRHRDSKCQRRSRSTRKKRSGSMDAWIVLVSVIMLWKLIRDVAAQLAGVLLPPSTFGRQRWTRTKRRGWWKSVASHPEEVEQAVRWVVNWLVGWLGRRWLESGPTGGGVGANCLPEPDGGCTGDIAPAQVSSCGCGIAIMKSRRPSEGDARYQMLGRKFWAVVGVLVQEVENSRQVFQLDHIIRRTHQRDRCPHTRLASKEL